MPNARARGRPRTFDTREKLEQIQQVFWKKGFAATSLDDLSETTGLSRPSLYAAYGNKTATYTAALELFAERMVETAVPALYGGANLRAALIGFYSGALGVYFGKKKTSLGCMVFTSAVADAGANPQIRKSVAGFLNSLDEALAAGIAQHEPSLSAEQCARTAELAAGGLMNIATRARAGADRASLQAVAERTADFLADSCEALRGA